MLEAMAGVSVITATRDASAPNAAVADVRFRQAPPRRPDRTASTCKSGLPGIGDERVASLKRKQTPADTCDLIRHSRCPKSSHPDARRLQ